MYRLKGVAVAAAITVVAAAGAEDVSFTDDFEAGASPLWGNELGAWVASDGAYSVTFPDNFPNTYSSLPWTFADVTVETQIQGVFDGGLWLRATAAPGSVGIKGVLLVTHNTGLYWHISDGGSYGASLNPAPGIYEPGSTIDLRVEVTGDTYAAYVNGSERPVTTLETSDFCSGRVAVYDYSGQSFASVTVEGETVCCEDLDADGDVDGADLGILLGNWGNDGASDINGDGVTNGADLGLLLGAWGDC